MRDGNQETNQQCVQVYVSFRLDTEIPVQGSDKGCELMYAESFVLVILMIRTCSIAEQLFVLIFPIGFSELTGFIGFAGRGKMRCEREFLLK